MGGPAVGISTVQTNGRHAVIYIFDRIHHKSHALDMDVDIICLAGIAAQELGYDSVTLEQRLVIESFVKGQDVFVSYPTGSGKSLCY